MKPVALVGKQSRIRELSAGLTRRQPAPSFFEAPQNWALEPLQENIMQTKLKLGKAALCVRRVGMSVAILTAVPLIGALTTPNQALAGCGVSHPSGLHAASATASTGVHAATGISAASGGGGTVSGCSTGASASAVSGLTTTGSGRVVEMGGAHAGRTENHVRTATTRTTNTAAHFHAFGAGHRV
jgi:hypothetical protein